MKIAYAFRRSTVYPHEAKEGWNLQPEPALTNFLGKVREIGFDGIELGFEVFGGHNATKQSVSELQKVLATGFRGNAPGQRDLLYGLHRRVRQRVQTGRHPERR